MTLKDMGALLVKGTSVSDIKELQELSKTHPDIVEIAKTGTSLQDIKELISLSEAEGSQAGEASQGGTGESDQTPPDFKQMYEEQLKKSEELEKKVSEIQKKNAGEDISGKKTDEEDILLDILKNSL